PAHQDRAGTDSDRLPDQKEIQHGDQSDRRGNEAVATRYSSNPASVELHSETQKQCELIVERALRLTCTRATVSRFETTPGSKSLSLRKPLFSCNALGGCE